MIFFKKNEFTRIRKESLKKLRDVGVENINNNLPLLDFKTEIKSKKELIHRIEILHLLYTISVEGIESKSFFYTIIKEKGLDQSLSIEERMFLENEKYSDQSLINLSWYKESMFSLLWCAGLVDNIEVIEEINMGDIYHIIPPEVEDKEFNKSITTRSLKDILIMLDYYYNIHWSYKHSTDLDKKKLSIIYERRKSLEWYLYNNDWDKVSLDT